MQLLVSNEQDQVQVAEEILIFIEKALTEILQDGVFAADPEVSLLLIDDARMAALNAQYRGVDGTTDVLSFAMLENANGEVKVPEPGEEFLLGDIVISVPRAQMQAQNAGHSLAHEMVFLAVHGVLHLLGYDHETTEGEARMRRREQAVLAGLGFEEPGDAWA